MADRDSHTNEPAERPGGNPRSRLRVARGLRYVLYGLVGLVGFALLVVLVLLLLLQTPWGADRAKDIVVDQLNPLFQHGARVRVDSVSGNFLSRVTLYDVEFMDGEGRRMAHVDTLGLQYSLWRYLLRNRIVIRDVYAGGPQVHMRQNREGQWDLIRALPPADTTAKQSALALHIDDLAARNGSARVDFYAPEPDSSVLTAGEVNVVFSDLASEQNIRLKVDTVWGHFTPPEALDPVRIRGSGLVGDSLITVNRLRLNSSRSDVYADGTLRVPHEEGEPLQDIDFTLAAEPLAFRDLVPFVPNINRSGYGTVNLRVQGTSRLLDVKGEAQFGDGSSLSLNGVVTPFAEGDLTYEMDAMARQFSPGYFQAGGTRNVNLNADAHLDLAGTNLDGLSGTVSGRLFNTQFGAQEVREARVRATFEEGHTEFSASGTLRGAQLSLEGTGRLFDDVPTYQMAGRFQQVNIGQLLNNPQQESDLNGRFTLEGSGFNPPTASVTGRFTFTNSTLNGRQIERGVATLTLENGNLSFDVEFEFPGGYVAMQGQGAFQNDTFTYRITQGRFRNLNLAAFTGNPANESDLTGTFTASGEGLNLDEMSLQANVSLAAGRYSGYRINRADFGLTLQNRELAAGGQLDLVGGQAEFTLSGRFFEETPTYDLEGHFSGVDIGELLQNPQQSSTLNGRFSLRGSGLNPETARLTGSFRLYDSVLNDNRIEEGTAEVSLRSGNLDFNANFRTPAGSIAGQGTATFRQGTVSYNVYEGRFEDLNVALLTGDPGNTSDLTGTFTAQGRGTSLSSLTLDVQATLEASQFNRQQIEEGNLRVSLEEGQLDFTADVLTPEGRVLFEGGGNLLGETPTFALREGSFEGLNLGALLGLEDVNTDLNGTLQFTGEGQPQTGVFEVIITLRPSTINAAQLQDGRVTAAVRNGFVEAEAGLNFVEGRVQGAGQARFGEGPPQYEVRGSLSSLDLAAALTGSDSVAASVSLNFEVAGTGLDPETMRLKGQIEGGQAAYRTTRIDQLETSFLLDDGLLHVDTLLVRANFANVTGSGQIALFDPQGLLRSNFAFQADLKDLKPIRPFIPAENFALRDAHIEGRAFGPVGTLRFETSARLQNLVYNQVRIADLEGRLTGAVDSSRTLTVAELDAEAGYLSIPQLTVENTQIEATYDDQTVTFALDVTVDERRDMHLIGDVNLRPGRERLIVDDLTVHLDEDEWELLQPAQITYDEGFRISNLLLFSEGQQIAIDGVINPSGQQNLVLTIENFRIGAVADLLGLEGLGGTLSGSVSLTGAASSPEASGTLMFDIESYDHAVGDLQLALEYANQTLDIQALLTHENESTLSVAGQLPLDLRLATSDSVQVAGQPGISMQAGSASPQREVDLTVQADSFSVDWVRPFLDPGQVEDLRGRFTANIDVGGTLEAPVLDGSARFVNGHINLPQQGVAYDDIQADLQLVDNVVRLENFRIRSGEGEITGEGTVNLTELTLGNFNIDLEADNFEAIDTRQYRAVASGNLTLRGTTRKPVLRGGVNVMSADIYVDEMAQATNLEEVSLSEEDVQMLERNFGMRLSESDTTTFDFYQALDMELDVELERDVWLRSRSNPDMNIQFTGALDVSKPPYGEEQVFGTIEVIEARSYIEQFGRRFNITSGTLRFNGPPMDPRLDIEAALPVAAGGRSQDALDITLSLEGSLDNLEINLGSDQQLGARNIVSYLATGRPAGQSLQGSGLGTSDLLGSGAGIALSQLTSIIEGAAGEELGLDVIEIETGGPRGTVLTAGKYVTERLFVGIEQPISVNPSNFVQENIDPTNQGTQVTIEYEIMDWLLARLGQRGSSLQFDLFWEYSY